MGVETLTFDQGKIPVAGWYGHRFEFLDTVAGGDKPIIVFIDRPTVEPDVLSFAAVVIVRADDLAIGESWFGFLADKIFPISLANVRLHLFGIGQDDKAAVLAHSVEKGAVREFEELFRIGIDNGGTFYVCFAADTAYY